MMTGLFRHILSALLLLNFSGVYTEDDVHIKIVEAPAAARYPSWHSSNSQSQLVLRTHPNTVSGPPHLQQLAGQCFEASQQGYTYEVCPFNNVTQKEERVSWNSFHGVLGVWREWVVDNDTFSGMLYSMGEACGNSDREAKVLFNCSTITRLHNISEPSTCSYVIWMDTPLACFKGAMQIYHVLSENQLRDWEVLDHDYYSGEITFQGLSKKRKKLLSLAGLLQEFVKKEPSHEERMSDVDDTDKVTVTQAQCVKEKFELQKQLNELRGKVGDLMRENPSIHFDSELRSLASESEDDHVEHVAVDTLNAEQDELADLINEEALNEQLALLDDIELQELLKD